MNSAGRCGDLGASPPPGAVRDAAAPLRVRPMFSARIPADLAPNRIGRAVSRLRAAQAELIDLTESNPTRVGFRFPPGLLRGVAEPQVQVYRPAPLGLPAARAAVAAHLTRPGRVVAPERVALTASTSEAYGFLFKLLCDPGDAVMVPRPSYPLFEHLTRLEGVRALPYALDHHVRWELDPGALREALTPSTRAVLLVNPNNPTGSFVSTGEVEAVARICREHDLALIADEVFGAYPLHGAAPGPSVLDRPRRDVLAFSLGGLSKAVGLPQLKLGWIVADGPPAVVERALARLELIGDTYLSVAAPVQLAAGVLLEEGAAVTAQIAARVRANYAALRLRVERHPAIRLPAVDGGWYAVLQIPATEPEETVVLELLERDRVLVHPGYFFDFPREAFLVVSLLPAPDAFEVGIARVLARVAGEPGR